MGTPSCEAVYPPPPPKYLYLLCSLNILGKDKKYRSPYLLFTNRVTLSVQGNTKPDLYVRPELARDVHIHEEFLFPSTDRVSK